MDDVTKIRSSIERWASAVQAHDLEAAVAGRADDIVMFDVPPPEDGVRGIAAYRASWPPLFEWLGPSGTFELVELDVVAGDRVAYAYGLLRCGTREALRETPTQRLRLTIALRKQGDDWIVTHEHHSFTAKD